MLEVRLHSVVPGVVGAAAAVGGGGAAARRPGGSARRRRGRYGRGRLKQF